MLTKEAVISAASHAAFGSPLVVNNLRAILVEAIVQSALGPQWKWCSTDYAGWDFEHEDGTRLEVKQSAARQSWSGKPKKPTAPRFDIAARTGYWEDGANWIPRPGRNAHVYVFGFHPITNDTADHRDPTQWQFFVVKTIDLPNAQSISLPSLRSLARCATAGELKDVADVARLSFVSTGCPPEVS